MKKILTLILLLTLTPQIIAKHEALTGLKFDISSEIPSKHSSSDLNSRFSAKTDKKELKVSKLKNNFFHNTKKKSKKALKYIKNKTVAFAKFTKKNPKSGIFVIAGTTLSVGMPINYYGFGKDESQTGKFWAGSKKIFLEFYNEIKKKYMGPDTQ